MGSFKKDVKNKTSSLRDVKETNLGIDGNSKNLT